MGVAAAAAGDRDCLGGGHLGAADAFAGDQRPHPLPRIQCSRRALVRTRGAVLRHGESGWGAVAVAAREVERGAGYDGAHGWGWGALVCGRPLTVRVGGILRMTEGFFGVCSWCGREQPEP